LLFLGLCFSHPPPSLLLRGPHARTPTTVPRVQGQVSVQARGQRAQVREAEVARAWGRHTLTPLSSHSIPSLFMHEGKGLPLTVDTKTAKPGLRIGQKASPRAPPLAHVLIL